MSFEIIHGDCLTKMREMESGSIDSIVTDPPYGLSFMGAQWDYEVPSVDIWREALRVLKPGGHLLSFFGTRTQHRGVVNIEDAGFEIRDSVMWVYGSGFPKSLDVSKAIDKAAGAEREIVGMNPNNRANRTSGIVLQANRDKGVIDTPATDAAKQWQGWGTALKPAHEPICVARKPFSGTVAVNVMEYGTGALNIDASRIGSAENTARPQGKDIRGGNWSGNGGRSELVTGGNDLGRWPANLIHDGSEEVLAEFAKYGERQGGASQLARRSGMGFHGGSGTADGERVNFADTGSAARFFYSAKASKAERGEGNNHPTVKNLALMRYLCRLITPPGGTVLDPFAGSGTTIAAALMEGFSAIGIEREAEFVAIASKRAALAANRDGLFAAVEP